MNKQATENEQITTWVVALETVGWVKMTAEEQMSYVDTVDQSDELFWVAVDIVAERDLMTR